MAAQGSLWALCRALVISALFLALYLGAVVGLHRGCAPLNQVARLLREMASRGGSSESAPSFEDRQSGPKLPLMSTLREGPTNERNESETIRGGTLGTSNPVSNLTAH